ncbi:MAG: hypothetical protein H6Q67_1615 [Firmicutes bacterium]|nr:hypothetical protein [Bacillota bacterium]
MGQAMGIYGTTTIDWESSFGVNPTTKAGYTLPFITNQIDSKQNLNKSSAITGTRNQNLPFYGNTDVSGTITTPVDLTSIGYWLKAAIGAPTTTVASSIYTHVFKVTTDDLPTMVIEKKVGSTYFLYNGCTIDSLKMSIGGDGELTAQIDVVGGLSSYGTTAYNSSATVVKQTNKLNQFQAAIKVGGSAVTGVVKSGDITISNNLDKTNYTVGGDGFRTSIPAGLVTVSGSMKTLFKDTSFLAYGANQTETSLELIWEISSSLELSLLCPEVYFNRADPLIAGPGGVELDLSWEAFYNNSSNASIIVATIVNGVTSY